MKNKKIIIIFILVIVLIIVGAILFNQYMRKSSGSIYTSSKEHKNYRIVCLAGDSGSIRDEQYLIIDSNRKVVEARRVITGYTDDELEGVYNAIKSIDEFGFNVEIRDKTIVYSSIGLIDQNADNVIESFKSIYTNVSVKEI